MPPQAVEKQSRAAHSILHVTIRQVMRTTFSNSSLAKHLTPKPALGPWPCADRMATNTVAKDQTTPIDDAQEGEKAKPSAMKAAFFSILSFARSR